MLRNKSLLLAILATPFLASCHQNASEKVISMDADMVYDSVSIAIDYPYLSQYANVTLAEKEGKAYMAGYNPKEHSMDFFPLDGGFPCSVPLEREGENGVLPPSHFGGATHGMSLLNHTGFVFIDMKGERKTHVPLSRLLDGMDGSCGIKSSGVTNGENNILTSHEGRTAVSLVPRDGAVKMNIGLLVNEQDGSTEKIPVMYPDGIVKMVPDFGDLAIPRIREYKDRIVFNFPCSSSVFVYDKKSGKTRELGMCSNMAEDMLAFTPEASENEVKMKFEFEVTSTRFKEVYFDEESNRYYRVLQGAKKSVFDRFPPQYLSVMNEKGTRIQEYRLPVTFSTKYVYDKGKFYFVLNSSDDMTLNIAVLDLGS